MKTCYSLMTSRIPSEFWTCRKFVTACVSSPGGGLLLGHAAPELWADLAIARLAVEQSGRALQFVSHDLQDDRYDLVFRFNFG